jgi:hypothetical protein
MKKKADFNLVKKFIENLNEQGLDKVTVSELKEVISN